MSFFHISQGSILCNIHQLDNILIVAALRSKKILENTDRKIHLLPTRSSANLCNKDLLRYVMRYFRMISSNLIIIPHSDFYLSTLTFWRKPFRKLLNTCFLKNSFLLPFRLLNLILSLVISFNPFRFKSYDIIFIKIVYKLLSNCIKINLSSIQYTTPIVIEFRQYRITFNVFYHQRAFHILDQSRNSQIV